jgi:hypothetical protein
VTVPKISNLESTTGSQKAKSRHFPLKVKLWKLPRQENQENQFENNNSKKKIPTQKNVFDSGPWNSSREIEGR